MTFHRPPQKQGYVRVMRVFVAEQQALKHFKTGFSRLRVLCGDAEVTPIHPFIIEHPVSETETLNEGLYVFDPDALGPQCSSVRLVLYSQKSAEKGDTRPIDPKVIQRVWQDFAAWRQ